MGAYNRISKRRYFTKKIEHINLDIGSYELESKNSLKGIWKYKEQR